MDKELIPLMSSFGAAVHDAQVLEQSFKLLLSLIKHEKGLDFDETESIWGNKNFKTLGDLFEDSKSKEYFTGAEENIIKKTIKLRNDLVHSFLTNRAVNVTQPEGREDTIKEIQSYREVFWKANQIVDDLIDKYLEEYGLTVEAFKEKMDSLWVEDKTH